VVLTVLKLTVRVPQLTKIEILFCLRNFTIQKNSFYYNSLMSHSWWPEGGGGDPALLDALLPHWFRLP